MKPYPNPRVMAFHYWHDGATGEYALMILAEMRGVGPVEYQCWIDPDKPVVKEDVITLAADLKLDEWRRIEFIDQQAWLSNPEPLEAKWYHLSKAMAEMRDAVEGKE